MDKEPGYKRKALINRLRFFLPQIYYDWLGDIKPPDSFYNNLKTLYQKIRNGKNKFILIIKNLHKIIIGLPIYIFLNITSFALTLLVVIFFHPVLLPLILSILNMIFFENSFFYIFPEYLSLPFMLGGMVIGAIIVFDEKLGDKYRDFLARIFRPILFQPLEKMIDWVYSTFVELAERK